MSSLRSLAGLGEVLDESCGDDVDDELAMEVDDCPGTTRTKFSAEVFSHSWSDVAFSQPHHCIPQWLASIFLISSLSLATAREQ